MKVISQQTIDQDSLAFVIVVESGMFKTGVQKSANACKLSNGFMAQCMIEVASSWKSKYNNIHKPLKYMYFFKNKLLKIVQSSQNIFGTRNTGLTAYASKINFLKLFKIPKIEIGG